MTLVERDRTPSSDIVVMTDHSSEEGSARHLIRAVRLLTDSAPTVLDARLFYDGGEGQVRLDGSGLTLDVPSRGLSVRPSVVVIYEIPPTDRPRFVSFLAAVERSGASCLGANVYGWLCATDKQFMVRRFLQDGIAQMESIALNRPSLSAAVDAFERLGGNIWARPIVGCGGNDVFHVTSHIQLRMAVEHYAQAGTRWLVTRDAGNFDQRSRRHQFRVIVLGDRVLRVCEHVQDDADAPCNEARGAVSTTLTPDALPTEMLALAARATRSLGLRFGGVAHAVENGGVVFEVNVHPVIDVPQGFETVAVPLVQAHLAGEPSRSPARSRRISAKNGTNA